jgi:hypothetical protein
VVLIFLFGENYFWNRAPDRIESHHFSRVLFLSGFSLIFETILNRWKKGEKNGMRCLKNRPETKIWFPD